MKRIFSVLLLAMLGATGPRAADTLSHYSQQPRQLSDSIIVTANRVGIPAEKSVWPVASVDRRSLENQSGLETALEGRAGLDIRNHSGFGSISTLSNWGLFNRHMLLLYNGRVVKDYSLGGFNLSDFSSEELQRVEILKGPQSAFYGADAIGGVVNLITPDAMTNRAALSVKQGTFGFQRYLLNLSRRFGSFGFAGYAEISEAANHRENAGAERMVFDLKTSYLSADARHSLSVSARYFEDSLGVPGPDPLDAYVPIYGSDDAWSMYDHQLDENYSMDFQYRFDDSVFGSAQVDAFWEKKNLDYNSLYNYQYSYYTYDESVTPVDSFLNVESVDVLSRSIYNKRSFGAGGRYARGFGPGQLAGGIDFLSGSIRSTTDETSLASNIEGPYAPYSYEYGSYNYWRGSQDQFDIWSSAVIDAVGGFQFDLSGRLQFVKSRTTQPSYNLGATFFATEELSLKIGYAYAFRLPSISEQFAEDVFTAGNEEIKPETSRSLIGTAELSLPRQALRGRLTIFHQTVDSLVQYQFDPTSFYFVPRNVDRFKTVGIDIDIQYRPFVELGLSLNTVAQQAQQTIEGTGVYVDAFYVPDLKWRFDVTGQRDIFGYGLNLTYTSDRSILQSGRTRIIDAVYELGFYLSASVGSNISLSLTGYDLTDQRRPDQFGFSEFDDNYPSPGRRFMIGATYSLF
ncbi:MAG: TonB-dependent receptor [Candidatus Zixiibacteriota bacterium]